MGISPSRASNKQVSHNDTTQTSVHPLQITTATQTDIPNLQDSRALLLPPLIPIIPIAAQEYEQLKLAYKTLRIRSHRATIHSSAQIFELKLQLQELRDSKPPLGDSVALVQESEEETSEIGSLRTQLAKKTNLILDLSIRLSSQTEELERVKRTSDTSSITKRSPEVREMQSMMVARAAR